MPLFFLIAIGAGAISLGAATADVVEDGQIGQTNHYAYSAPAQPQYQPQSQAALAPSFDASAYASTTDCLNAAALQGAPATACQK
jgi:hypothetical protein